MPTSFGLSPLINTTDDIMNSDFATNRYGESWDSSCENS